jgi:deoxyadenosine/deoxycytidine kinase
MQILFMRYKNLELLELFPLLRCFRSNFQEEIFEDGYLCGKFRCDGTHINPKYMDIFEQCLQNKLNVVDEGNKTENIVLEEN